jgi:membrane protein implicated in regulation of membrane protease activity
MDQTLWWIWILVGAAFVVGEIFTAGFFLLPIGIAAGLTGLAALLGGGAGIQWAVFVVVSAILIGFSRRFANRVSKEQPPGIGADRFVGEECVVLEEIDNVGNTGRVRLGKEEWRAESDTGDPITSGQRVVVTRISGTQLIVKPL